MLYQFNILEEKALTYYYVLDFFYKSYFIYWSNKGALRRRSVIKKRMAPVFFFCFMGVSINKNQKLKLDICFKT